MDLNKVILVGRLGKDPVKIETKTGTSMCRLRIATNKISKSDNKTTEITAWHEVVVFNKQADLCLQFLSSGREVWIEGRIEYSTRKINEVEFKEARIVADSVGFLGGQKKRVTPPFLKETDSSELSTVVSSITGDDHGNSTLEVLVEQDLEDGTD